MSAIQIICIALFAAITIAVNVVYFMMRRKMAYYDIPYGIAMAVIFCNGVVFASILLGAWGIFG